MRFKAKLRRIGNSLGILIPKEVITFVEDEQQVNVITKGDYVCLEVITNDIPYYDLPCGVITLEDKDAKDVITKEEEREKEALKVITPINKVITLKRGTANRKKQKYQGSYLYQMCPKHPGSMKITCGCK